MEARQTIKALTALTAISLITPSQGQGTVVFSNRNLVDVAKGEGPYNAPVSLPDGTRVSGAGFTAGLFLMQSGSLTEITTEVFQTGALAGFFAPTVVEIPGVPTGASATFITRVWETSAGSYENAAATGGYYGEFKTATGDSLVAVDGLGFPLGDPQPMPPPYLFGIQSLTLVPEPSAISMFVGGIFLWILSRRRSKDATIVTKAGH